MTFNETIGVALASCLITTLWVMFGLSPDRERSFAMNGAMIVDGVQYRVIEAQEARRMCELRPSLRRPAP